MVAMGGAWLGDPAADRLEILSVETLPPRQTRVNTSLARSGNGNARLAFDLQPRGGTWVITDVILEGISLAKVQRTEFEAVLRRGGMGELTARLHTVVDAMSGILEATETSRP
jgi:ABC-type transporter MlaC component